jgi:hypothetical protein
MIVAEDIGSLKVAVTFWLIGTLVAALAGFVEVTFGWDTVVNVHTKFAASPTPAGSCAPVVIVAVNKVLAARAAVGVNVAVLPA